MKKTALLITVLFIAQFTTLLGQIIETHHFSEIKKYIKPNSLVILDIDDTLLIPAQMLGTDVWFRHRIKQHEEKGLPPEEALYTAVAEWEAIRNITPIEIVEKGTDKVIEDIQKEQITVMGLTTQALTLTRQTTRQLRFINIDLMKSAPYDQDLFFSNGLGVLYHKGILFTAGTPKGEALLKFLDAINKHYDHVVFINDKASHLTDVEVVLKAKNIDFIGLRYSYSDAKNSQFRKEIADIQWKHSSLGRILSDKEAEELLHIK